MPFKLSGGRNAHLRFSPCAKIFKTSTFSFKKRLCHDIPSQPKTVKSKPQMHGSRTRNCALLHCNTTKEVQRQNICCSGCLKISKQYSMTSFYSQDILCNVSLQSCNRWISAQVVSHNINKGRQEKAKPVHKLLTLTSLVIGNRSKFSIKQIW